MEQDNQLPPRKKTGCDLEEYTQRVNGEFQRCTAFQCPNSPSEITCRKI